MACSKCGTSKPAPPPQEPPSDVARTRLERDWREFQRLKMAAPDVPQSRQV
jgi:hypothetical protein